MAADTFCRHWQEVLKIGTRQAYEVPLVEKADVSCWVCFESLAIYNESGNITRWGTARQDISDRTLAEAKLVSERVPREAIIGSMTDAIMTVEEGKRVVVLNHAAESLKVSRQRVIPLDRASDGV